MMRNDEGIKCRWRDLSVASVQVTGPLPDFWLKF
jgi:hypothetical protein